MPYHLRPGDNDPAYYKHGANSCKYYFKDAVEVAQTYESTFTFMCTLVAGHTGPHVGHIPGPRGTGVGIIVGIGPDPYMLPPELQVSEGL